MKAFALNKRNLLLVVICLQSFFLSFSQTLEFYNLQFPETGTQIQGGIYDVYAQVYAPGITNLSNIAPGPGISAWIGFSTSNTNPNTWTDWVPANYNVDVGNNDEFVANIGPSIPFTGTYYYASRFQYNTESYVYGGILADGTAGGEWDGVTYISGVLTITCPSTTTWDGAAWTPPTGPNASTEVIIDGPFNTAGGFPQSSFDACELTVTTNGTLFVSDGDYVRVENDITIDGTFIVEHEGSVVQINDNALVTGSAVVRKKTAEMNNYYEYTYWSSPVLGETIGNGLASSDVTRRFSFEAANFKDSFQETNNNNAADPGQDDIDDDGDDWQYAPAATVMESGKGYASHHEESIFILPPPATLPYQFVYTFTGPFNNGIVNAPVMRNETPPIENLDINWNLIGNPYPSAIDVDLFFDANNYDAATNPDGTLTGAVYLWSQDSPPSGTNNGNENLNFTSADYAIINGIGAIPAQEIGGDGVLPNRYIPSGQGFFVAYSDIIPSGTGNVVFNNSMRVIGNNDQFFRNSNDEENKFALKITTEDGIFNQMLVGYKEGATNQKDEMYYDAPRNLASGVSAIIYSIIEGSTRKFAIQGRDINSLNTNDVIPIGIKNTVDGQTEFTIAIADVEGNFLNNNGIILKDNLLDIEHNLSDSGYTFTLDSGEFNSRFEIIYANTLSVNEIIEDTTDIVLINSLNNYLELSTSQQSEISQLKLYDLLGRQLFEIDVRNESKVIIDGDSLSNSIFIVELSLSNGKELTQKFINN